MSNDDSSDASVGDFVDAKSSDAAHTKPTTGAAAASLAEQRQSRKNAKAAMTRVLNAVEANENMSVEELECRLGVLESYYKLCSDIQFRIERLDPGTKSRVEIDELYIKTKTKIKSALSGQRRSSVVNESFQMWTPPLPMTSVTHLPPLNLPKFGGKYSEFKGFMNTFEILVNKNSTICDTEKFNLLLQCLTNQARDAVATFPNSAENYPKALHRLKQLYDNNCLIFLEHVSALFDISKLTKVSQPSLRSLVDKVSANYAALKTLGSFEQICDALIISITMSKVDTDTKAKWEESLDFRTLPKWSACNDMLDRRCQRLEAAKVSTQKPEITTKSSLHVPSKPHNTSFNVHSCTKTPVNAKVCHLCQEPGHSIYNCQTFIALSVPQRWERVREYHLCTNCFAKSHLQNKCKSKYSCKHCNGRHHSMLHTVPDSGGSHISETQSACTATRNESHARSQVILATALILVKDSSGDFHLARALLDNCSQVNFIREGFAQSLRLKSYRRNVEIGGVNDSCTKTNYSTQTVVRSRMNGFETSLEFLITSTVSNYQPEQTMRKEDWNVPQNVQLADPDFNKLNKIDMLIGGELFFELLSIGQIKLGPGLPILQKSVFGWLVGGACSTLTPPVQRYHSYCTTTEPSLEKLVSRFWELEEVDATAKSLTPEQQSCEDHYVQHVSTQSDGRIMTKLPFKIDPCLLGGSYNTALRRLYAIERRLAKDIHLYQQYKGFMREYEELNHMQQPESTTTKLRVVFDASCKTDSQLSLNDVLMVGPTIQRDLLTTLLRFRCHRFGLTGDITKMYRQVLVDPADRAFQMILWRETSSQPVQMYALNTVTYGTSAAPFLAIRSLQFIAERCRDLYPIGSQALLSEFYVDDMLSGADNLHDLRELQRQTTSVLDQSLFTLSKWHTNHPDFRRELNSATQSKPLKSVETDSTSTLGINWDSTLDEFHFLYQPRNSSQRCSKRSILSQSSSLFDPMGLLSPIIIRVKILLQDLWILKTDWDESVPQSLETLWRNFIADLDNLPQVRIPRFVLCPRPVNVQVHGFCDASTRAYGCVLYLRCEAPNGDIVSQLLVSKSRVAFIKVKTIPRLELCGAHLLSNLWGSLRDSLDIPKHSVYFWSDSQVVLHWLQTHSSTLTTFVGNRVASIQETVPDVVWSHVPSSQNPADLISRGTTVHELNQSMWIHGPEFLCKPSGEWPQGTNVDLPDDQRELEKKKTVLLCQVAKHPLLETINNCSSYPRVLRIFAYIARFIKIKCQNERFAVPVSSQELRSALHCIVSIIQHHYFHKEIHDLKSGRIVAGSLNSLCPFLDTTHRVNLLRVGGRLQHADIPSEAKHPLLLPKAHPFVSCLVRHLHQRNYHAGPKSLVAIIRQQFWIVNAREVATRVVNNCIHCTRYKPKLMEQIMGNLPKPRVTQTRPFQCCGVDFCGPIATFVNLRGSKSYKTYIAVFVCFATKAVHLEAVSDLSSNKFIEALKRMIGRRGIPAKIFCDNATNFVGANSVLKELREQFFKSSNIDSVHKFCASSSIEFKFIPPRAPHFGGLWEAAVKVAKGHLLRTLSHARLTFEELSTALIEIESVMNSRPISPISADPNDLDILTPGHFLIGTSLKAIPELVNAEAEVSHLQRWKRVSAIKTHFWRRWHQEYLQELQARNKWKRPQPNLEIGSMVLIHEDNTPPMNWRYGRVAEVVLGADGRARVAIVKTSKGVFKRPVAKLAVLPVC